jgi:hypothetical protein
VPGFQEVVIRMRETAVAAEATRAEAVHAVVAYGQEAVVAR